MLGGTFGYFLDEGRQPFVPVDVVDLALEDVVFYGLGDGFAGHVFGELADDSDQDVLHNQPLGLFCLGRERGIFFTKEPESKAKNSTH